MSVSVSLRRLRYDCYNLYIWSMQEVFQNQSTRRTRAEKDRAMFSGDVGHQEFPGGWRLH
jgi:hypothetical protein